MTNTIKIKRSAVASKVPQTGDLELGELAINTYDGKLFTKKDNGTASIVEIGGAGGNVALNDLTDVTITSASSGQVLKFDGSIWANAADSTFSGAYADLTGKPTLATVATSGAYADLSGTPSLATVATSGAYADLTGKPTVPSALDDLSDVVVSSAAKGQLIAHDGTSFVNTRTLEANAAATVPLTIKGAASQSGNLLSVTDSANVVLAAITPSSRLRLGTTAIAYSEIGFNSGDSTMRVTSINDNCFSLASPDNGSGVYTLTISRNTTRNTWEFSRGATNAIGYNFNTYAAAGGGLGVNLSTAPGAELHVNSNAAAKKGCIIRGAASQTANLFEAQDSAGTAMLSVSAVGAVTIADKQGNQTASALSISSTNVFSRLLTLTANASQGANMIELKNSGGTVVSSFGSDGQLYDNGMAVLAYRYHHSAVADGTASTVYNGGSPSLQVYNPTVWVNGVQKTYTTHYTISGNFITWTAGNIPASGAIVETVGSTVAWRVSSGDGVGFGYFPQIAVGTKRPGATSAATMSLESTLASKKALVVKAAASQTANLVEVQNSAGTALFSVDKDGSLAAGTVPVARVSGLATVATTGAYANLSGTPTIPSTLDSLSDVVITSAAKGQMVVHDGTNFVNTRTIEADVAATVPLTIKGAASQTANLFRVQNSAGTLFMNIESNGQVGINTIPSVRFAVEEDTVASASVFKVSATSALSSNCIICDKSDNNSTTSNRFMLFRVNNGTGSGQINANGASQAAFGTASDIRLKENVTDLPSQLDAFTRLRPVEFDYKSGAGHQIGFIAQEVEEVYPDLVGTDADGFLMITDMNKNDARIVKVIQELNEKIVALEARITSLESQ